MNCHCCQSDEVKKQGRFQNKNRFVQRYQCNRCGKTFSESQPLDGLRVDFKQACQVVHLACESMGIRAIERLTGLHRDTVLSILAQAGEKAARFLDEKIREVKASWIEVDEIHSFIFQKDNDNENPEIGEMFTYLSMDTSSKLIINSLVGKRNSANTVDFMEDLKGRMGCRFQLTTDAYSGYHRGPDGNGGAVGSVFGGEVDYATETKIFNTDKRTLPMYQAPALIGIKRIPRRGNPDMDLATICHCERLNLSVRTFTRRFARKCLGFSKKLENHKHAVSLFAFHFNFCRKHSAHGRTPAVAANLTDHQWTIEEMLSGPN
jgi:transposase-like protein